MEYRVITQFTNGKGRYVKVPKQCANCKYWEPRENKKYDKYSECDDGECHRYPCNVPCIEQVTERNEVIPELIHMSTLMTHPFVFAADWCGEFDMMNKPRWIDDEE